MNKLLGAALGLAIPFCALSGATGEERRALDVAVAPFGWTRLLTVQLLAALPLSWLCAERLRSRGAGPALAWCLIGTSLAGVTLAHGEALGAALGDASLFARALLRALWCLALQLPWCLAGHSLARSLARATHAPALTLAAMAALLLPALYTKHLIQVQTRRAEELLLADRLLPARSLLEGLAEVGASDPIAGKGPREVLAKLRKVIKVYSARAGSPLPNDAPPRVRLDRARTLRALGRPAEAERCLAGMPVAEFARIQIAAHVEALLLRADLLQDQKSWPESSRSYRQVLGLLAAASPKDREAVSLRVQAYDGLAFNARELRAFNEAADIYREAQNEVAPARAYFHFQLGRHYHHGGRPREALAELQAAIRLDPATFTAQAQPLIADLNARTPGCLSRWWP